MASKKRTFVGRNDPVEKLLRDKKKWNSYAAWRRITHKRMKNQASQIDWVSDHLHDLDIWCYELESQNKLNHSVTDPSQSVVVKELVAHTSLIFQMVSKLEDQIKSVMVALSSTTQVTTTLSSDLGVVTALTTKALRKACSINAQAATPSVSPLHEKDSGLQTTATSTLINDLPQATPFTTNNAPIPVFIKVNPKRNRNHKKKSSNKNSKSKSLSKKEPSEKIQTTKRPPIDESVALSNLKQPPNDKQTPLTLDWFASMSFPSSSSYSSSYSESYNPLSSTSFDISSDDMSYS